MPQQVSHNTKHYEKIIAYKNYLINELLKKVKALTAELEQSKNK